MTNERRSQSITVSAKTVAEAIAEAEQRLGLSQSEIDITVISEGSKGFLGMGGENARILAMPKAILSRRVTENGRTARAGASQAPVEEASAQPPAPTPPVERPAQPAPAPAIESIAPIATPAVPAPPVARAESQSPADDEGDDEGEQSQGNRADPALVAEVAVEVVRELILRMGIDAQATVRSIGNPVVIDVMGEDLGLLIGRHGDTLGSLQYLVNAIVGKRVHRWSKVIIDVEHYRARREDTLRQLANRQAARVRGSQQELVLDPMPAAERRVVHMALQNSPWVVTSSVGEEPNRRVVIAPRQGPR